MIRTGLDRLMANPVVLEGRRYGLLAHGASVTTDLRPAHMALAAAGQPPARLFGPEHGYYGVEQDMVPAEDHVDPWTGIETRSLYGRSSSSLRPAPEALDDLDLLVVDLQDVGSRYYTYAATGVWAAEVALETGCEVWVLDRPNPLGGAVVEGNLRRSGFDSFVGAFEHPVRHGLTLAELARLELGLEVPGLSVWPMEGWRREMLWPETGRRWIAPSPNMPTFETAVVYPGLCLLEGTQASEGRGTTRPFLLVGAPELDPVGLAARLNRAALPGMVFVPTYFRPQFQKHAGMVCGGVEVVVTNAAVVAAFRVGVELVAALFAAVEGDVWRSEVYEFVSRCPAIDLLAGTDALRCGLESGDDLEQWIGSWADDERRFRERRQPALLYPEPT